MDYKNLFNRLLFSLFFFIVYFASFNNKYILFIFGTIIYLIIFFEILKFFKKFKKLIFLYSILSYCSFFLYFFNYYDFLIFNIFVFTIILFDSFSYFIGKFFGKNYIFKYVSPKKTLEGYIGGLFFTNLFIYGYIYFNNNQINTIYLLIIVNLTIIFSTVGDLIESFFKRQNNIKDSSIYIPGHGGYFDRFDSFMTSIIMLTVLNFFLNI